MGAGSGGYKVGLNFQRHLVMITGVAQCFTSLSGTMEVSSFEKDLSIFTNLMTNFSSEVVGRMEPRS